jgi:putative inorganic carbon (HCO3(-)) transporter
MTQTARASQTTQALIGLGWSGAIGVAWFLLSNPIVAIGIAIAPLAILLAWRVPFQLCLGFVVLSFFRLHEAFPMFGPLHLPLILAFGTLTVMVGKIALGQIETFWTREMTVFAIFAALCTIGIIFATNHAVAMAYWSDTYVKIILMVFALAWVMREPGQLAQFGWAMIAAGLLLAMVAISNELNGIGLVEGTRVTIGRDFGSVLGDPNDLSLVLLFPLSFSAAFIVSPRMTKSARLFGAIGTAAAIWAVLCTQSRGGLCGTLAVFAILGVRLIKSKLVLAGIGGFAALALFAAAGVSQRASGGAAESGIDESSMGRIYAWQAAWGMACDHPLFGVGLDDFRYNFFTYTPHFDGLAKAVHSTWFGVLAETGFVGIILFITLVTLTLRRAIRTSMRLNKLRLAGDGLPPTAFAVVQAVPAGLASFIVSGSFLTQGFTWPLYILLSLALAVGRIAEDAALRSSQDARDARAASCD